MIAEAKKKKELHSGHNNILEVQSLNPSMVTRVPSNIKFKYTVTSTSKLKSERITRSKKNCVNKNTNSFKTDKTDILFLLSKRHFSFEK